MPARRGPHRQGGCQRVGRRRRGTAVPQSPGPQSRGTKAQTRADHQQYPPHVHWVPAGGHRGEGHGGAVRQDGAQVARPAHVQGPRHRWQVAGIARCHGEGLRHGAFHADGVGREEIGGGHLNSPAEGRQGGAGRLHPTTTPADVAKSVRGPCAGSCPPGALTSR